MDCSPPGPFVHGISQTRYWRGLPFPFPGDLPNPWIEQRSPTLQADSLPSEPQGSPTCKGKEQKHVLARQIVENMNSHLGQNWQFWKTRKGVHGRGITWITQGNVTGKLKTWKDLHKDTDDNSAEKVRQKEATRTEKVWRSFYRIKQNVGEMVRISASFSLEALKVNDLCSLMSSWGLLTQPWLLSSWYVIAESGQLLNWSEKNNVLKAMAGVWISL